MNTIDRALPLEQATMPPSSWVLAASSFAFVIVQLDVTIVNVALPRIGAELGAGVAGLQWVVDAYTLGFAVFLLSAGVLGDRYGSRRVFLAGFMLFLAASAACGMATGALALNIARAVQGVGAALLVPSSLAILNHAYAHDRKRLAHAIAMWTAAGGVSIAAGPVIGGLLLSVGGWRSIFWVNLPICAAGFLITWRSVPVVPRAAGGASLDVAGQVLAIVALTGFIGAVIEAPTRGIMDPLVAAGLVLAVLAGIAFLAVEKRVRTPMIPLRLFRDFNFSAAVTFGVLVNFAYYGIIFVLSFYLQVVRQYSVLEAGLAFLPLTGTFIFSNIASGWVAGRYGLRLPMIVGGVIGGIGYALLATLGVGPDTGFLHMLPGMVLIPAGMGLAVPAMTTSILSGVRKEMAGTASAILNAARQVGGATGVAIFGAMVGLADASHAIGGVRAALFASALLLFAAALLAWLARRE